MKRIKLVSSIVVGIIDFLGVIQFAKQMGTQDFLSFIWNNIFILVAIISTIGLVGLFLYWEYQDYKTTTNTFKLAINKNADSLLQLQNSLNVENPNRGIELEVVHVKEHTEILEENTYKPQKK